MAEPDGSGAQMWKKFESEGLIVDIELQEVLKAMKYDNLSVLAKFTKEDEETIVSFMRTTFHKLIKVEDRERFYGIFQSNPDLFEFVGGQKKTIGFITQMARKLVNLTKQKSVANLFKDSISRKPAASQDAAATEKSKTIVDYSTELQNNINKYLNDTFEGEFNIGEVKVAQDGLGSFIALAPCPACSKPTKITRLETRWNTSNYYAHVRTHVDKPIINEKNSQTLDKFFTKSPTDSPSTSNTSNNSRRRLVPRQDMSCTKRRKLDKSKERRYNSDEEEMLDILEGSDNETFEHPNPEQQKRNRDSSKQRDQKEDEERGNGRREAEDQGCNNVGETGETEVPEDKSKGENRQEEGQKQGRVEDGDQDF